MSDKAIIFPEIQKGKIYDEMGASQICKFIIQVIRENFSIVEQASCLFENDIKLPTGKMPVPQ